MSDKPQAKDPAKKLAIPRPPTHQFVPASSLGPAVVVEPRGRRGFLTTFALGWGAFAAATGASLAAMGRFMFPNVLFEPPQSFKAGFPAEFNVDSVDERYKDRFGVWIVRSRDGFYALSTVCTHLGCTPNWLAAENKFKCPCHGSGFYRTGINFEGPAPRPLERYRVVMADDGQILIDKGKKYQQEKGEWKDPESFLKYA
jgi:cytochrome b6-f complex iron-sulfur subunit